MYEKKGVTAVESFAVASQGERFRALGGGRGEVAGYRSNVVIAYGYCLSMNYL